MLYLYLFLLTGFFSSVLQEWTKSKYRVRGRSRGTGFRTISTSGSDSDTKSGRRVPPEEERHVEGACYQKNSNWYQQGVVAQGTAVVSVVLFVPHPKRVVVMFMSCLGMFGSFVPETSFSMSYAQCMLIYNSFMKFSHLRHIGFCLDMKLVGT